MTGAGNGIADRWLATELRHLVALKAVAEEGSFRAAAARLGYVQSAVSQQIASLEAIVGCRLVDRRRGGRRPTLTEQGRLLLVHADAIVARMRVAGVELAASAHGKSRVLRVGSFQHVSARIVPHAVGRLRRRAPDVEVTLVEHEADVDVLEPLRRGELDLAFAEWPLASDEFGGREVFVDTYVVLAAADSPLVALGRPVTLEEVAQCPLIGHSGKRPRVEAHLDALGLRPTFVFRSDRDATIHGLVAARVGVAVVPRFSIDPSRAETVVLELDPTDAVRPWRVALAWPADRPPGEAATAFISATEEACRALGLAAA
ncbi:MAG TPA: LysR family transcriptional regulator [Gaiellaceae bacterium]